MAYLDKYPRKRITAGQVMAVTQRTKVVVSFGARDGGFEMVTNLRSRIMQKFGIPESDTGSVYLDAISLKGQPGERVDPNNPNKVLNDYWDDYYCGAMLQARTMITILTPPWLRSYWCWGEFDWINQLKGQKMTFAARNLAGAGPLQASMNLKVIYVVFPDAGQVLEEGQITVTDGNGDTQTRQPKNVWWSLKALEESVVLNVTGAQRGAINTPTLNGQAVNKDGCSSSYALSENDITRILAEVKP